MMVFSGGTIPAIQESIIRGRLLNEEARRVYATELIDTYSGFGKGYLINQINTTVKNAAVKQAMVNIAVCYPILQNFIDKLSMVYKIQPVRRFYLDGKEIIAEDPADGILDMKRFVVDEELYNTLSGIYSKELVARIKQAESMTNLLDTTIQKINNREGKICMDFVANDQASVIPNQDDPTQMDSIYFLRGLGNLTNAAGVRNYQPIYEYWTMTTFETLQGKNKTVLTNRAMDEMKLLSSNTEQKHIGSGFPPFVVCRSHMADDDFWALTDKDIIELIMQINMAYTELRYLQRFGAFGLKYVVNAKISQDATMDPTGILEIVGQQGVPGSEDKISVGEFVNAARIQELGDSIMGMVKLLYNLKNINMDSLVTTRMASTAEAKQIDRESLKEMIKTQQDMWSLNEENIFTTICAVYNRDQTTKKLPKGLAVKIDFYDAEKSTDQLKAELETWMIKIENDICTKIDWLKSDNPDLTDQEAEALLEKNQAVNANHSVQVGNAEDDAEAINGNDGTEKPDGDDADEIDPLTGKPKVPAQDGQPDMGKDKSKPVIEE